MVCVVLELVVVCVVKNLKLLLNSGSFAATYCATTGLLLLLLHLFQHCLFFHLDKRPSVLLFER